MEQPSATTIESIQEKLVYPEIKVIVPPLIQLISKIKNIEDYSAIVSDDTSGRILSLIFGEYVNALRAKRALPPAKRYFILGGKEFTLTDDTLTARRAFLQSKANTLGKTLLVTEYISTGHGMLLMIKDLEEAGINFVIAALSIAQDPNSYPRQITDRLFFGEIGSIGRDALWNKNQLTGVGKVYMDRAIDLSKETGYPLNLCALAWHVLANSPFSNFNNVMDVIKQWEDLSKETGVPLDVCAMVDYRYHQDPNIMRERLRIMSDKSQNFVTAPMKKNSGQYRAAFPLSNYNARREDIIGIRNDVRTVVKELLNITLHLST